jgi:hypothetical protein
MKSCGGGGTASGGQGGLLHARVAETERPQRAAAFEANVAEEQDGAGQSDPQPHESTSAEPTPAASIDTVLHHPRVD